jgi:hypothetical protein
MDPTENTAFIDVEACLLSNFLAIEVYSCGTDHLENISTVLLTVHVCWTVYGAVVWQRCNQIHYNIIKVTFLFNFATCFSFTRPSSGNCYLIEITTLHELHINIFRCCHFVSSLFKNIRAHLTHAIFLLLLVVIYHYKRHMSDKVNYAQ